MISSLHGIAALCAILVPSSAAQFVQEKAPAQRVSPVDPALAFLFPYGIANFSAHYIHSLQAFLVAEELYEAADYLGAREVLDDLWSSYPTGGSNWAALPTQPFGLNIGSPPGYYALRMLSDMVDWRLSSGFIGSAAPRTAQLTVVLVGESDGIEPQSLIELAFGLGVPAIHTLDPLLLQDENAVVHQSLQLFNEYVLAATEGMLGVTTEVLHLPDVTLPVEVKISGGFFQAGLTDLCDLWAEIPADVHEQTDWWWILYPSNVPSEYPDFQTTEFITGGMATGPDSSAPAFLIDDLWLVRKPPHLGAGLQSGVERRAYLPQWLQHEFFHHLFRTYPEFGLEQSSHQWFDLGTWPPDFVGTFEADYFHEALTKRLQDAEPPLHVALRYATADAPYDQLTTGDVLGTYRREPVENPWHIGDIEVSGNALRWINTAGVAWQLQPELEHGDLLTGPDCPYYAPPKGTKFKVEFLRDEMGDLTSTVEGFVFNGELYRLQ